ncbi:replication-relaxation family protein [Frankia sp. CiP3]|uniref:replication-relaxation family protein n=1 Tax=Frankia sp. CiP3 TaxID=2880971 RepID=UPI001EF6648B|nr:replication-relaxation family protein [Frankia sp. CiP3]
MITNPPQQTYLGRRTYARPTARIVSSGEHQLWLARHLTPRDRWITRMIHEHRVLTTHQIVELGWVTRRSANIRLLELYRWRVLDRFQPLAVSGLSPMHYVLDVAGAAVLAHEDGLDPKKIGYQHDRAMGIAHSLHLAHRIAVNGMFTRLIHHARRPDATGRLTAWWSEERCAGLYGDIVRPDGYGRWAQRGAEIEWFVELDFGTEPLRRLALKVDAYHRLAKETRITTPILIWTTTTRREVRIREALVDALRHLDQPARVPVATTAADLAEPDQHLDATLVRWLPLTRAGAGRLGLGQLSLVWPPLDRTATGHEDKISLPGRPNRLYPPEPMPPADGDHQLHAA